MSKILSALFLILSLVFSSHVIAWSDTGHVIAAEIAYNQLNAEKKKQMDAYAKVIFDALTETKKKELNYKFYNASLFAKTAALPDGWRSEKLDELFENFQAQVPANLLTASQEQTDKWHYIDTPYPNTTQCQISEEKNVVWSIDQLEKSISNENNFYSKALEIVLLTHYIGDIHQPLHTVTNVSLSCAGDRGGNNYCLKANTKGKCKQNLHALWDSAVGYLNKRENIKNLAFELQQTYPASQFQNEINLNNTNQWLDNKNIFFVYSTPQYTKPNDAYYQKGQEIAKQQLALAGYRLAAKLNKIKLST
jgi:hypothetical protein